MLKNSIFFIVLLLSISINCYSQNSIKTKNIESKDIPSTIKYKGKVKQAYLWSDKEGDHITFKTETGEFNSKSADNQDYRDANLFAYHYTYYKDTLNLNWKVFDGVKDCPVDIKAHFLANTFHVTDLDNNHQGEIWLMYKVACYGDVSPIKMKIVMYTGPFKYAMRGQTRVKLSESKYEGGEYVFDKAFLKGPKEFRDFAIKLWKK